LFKEGIGVLSFLAETEFAFQIIRLINHRMESIKILKVIGGEKRLGEPLL